jgi:hypothetical protein
MVTVGWELNKDPNLRGQILIDLDFFFLSPSLQVLDRKLNSFLIYFFLLKINYPLIVLNTCLRFQGLAALLLLYPPITYYWTVPLILDHSYLVGKSTSSNIADTKVLGF